MSLRCARGILENRSQAGANRTKLDRACRSAGVSPAIGNSLLDVGHSVFKSIIKKLIEIKNIVSDDLVVEIQKRGVAIDLAALWILGKGTQPKELNDMTGKSYREALLDIITTPGFSWMKWQSEYGNKCEAEDLKNSFGEKKATDVSVRAL